MGSSRNRWFVLKHPNGEYYIGKRSTGGAPMLKLGVKEEAVCMRPRALRFYIPRLKDYFGVMFTPEELP